MAKTLERRKLSDWEKAKGFIVKDANPSDKLTEEEFDKIPLSDKQGVEHGRRIKFLQDNGYEVTRENMVADLSARRN